MTPPRRREDRPDDAEGRRHSPGQDAYGKRKARRDASPTGRPPRKHKPSDRGRPNPGAAKGSRGADVHDADGIRLQKVLAAAGVGSRRACEELITQGRVSVDGQVVTELGVRVDPSRQVIEVDGERIQTDASKVYLAFNKPYNVVTSMNDDLGRIDISSYLGERNARLFHVGRLDYDTEGLLLLTNDGELANRLQHPQYGVPKTYLAEVPGPVPRDLGRRLREGVELEDGPAAVDSFRLVDSTPGKAVVEIVIHEGRKHIVRRLLEAVGHPVVHLVRTEVGPIRLGDTKAGKWRALSDAEVTALYKAAGL